MRLGSGVAMAVVQASSSTSDLTPSLGISICCKYGLKKPKKKKKKKKKREKEREREGGKVSGFII